MQATSISQRVQLVLFITGGLVLSFTFLIGYFSYQVKESTTEIVNVDLPFALNSLAMLEELGDMNSNLLEYLLGENEEAQEYTENFNELKLFRQNIPHTALNKTELEKIDSLIAHHQNVAQTAVFNKYDPSIEQEANQNITQLIEQTGRPLERLLDELKNEQVVAARLAKNVNEVLNQHLASVRYYLELVDEAGDMLADLTRFVLGDENAKYTFFSNAKDFELYLSRLRNIDNSETKKADLDKIEQLFIELKHGGENVFNKYSASSKVAAKNTVEQLEHSTFYHAEALLDTMSAQAKVNVEKSIADLNYQATVTMLVICFGVLICFTFFVFISFYARKMIFKPLDIITDTINSLRSGKLDNHIVKSNSDDELMRIITHLLAFQDELIELDKLRVVEVTMKNKLIQERDKATNALNELKAAQHQLIAHEKLASLGALVAGVAHEVNTPLGISVTTSTFISDKLKHFFSQLKSGKMRKDELTGCEDHIKESMSLLISSIMQAAKLIENFKQIAVDQGSAQRREFHLVELINLIISTLKHKLKNTQISFELHGDESILMDAYPGELTQVINNLFQNSIDHGFETNEAGLINISVTEDKGNALIIFSDNGRGVESKYLSRVFDPFFTTVPGVGGGCGLGLNIVHNIVTGLLGGEITVESTLREGTIFYIRIPKVTPIKQISKNEANSLENTI